VCTFGSCGDGNEWTCALVAPTILFVSRRTFTDSLALCLKYETALAGKSIDYQSAANSKKGNSKNDFNDDFYIFDFYLIQKQLNSL